VDTNEFANALIGAERAGGLTLAELVGLAESAELRELLRKVAHDEGYWARELTKIVKRAGGTPTLAIGDFASKVRAIPDLSGKIALLNRGQLWVVQKIDEHLPNVADPAVRGLLQAMAAAHRANIGLVDQAIAEPTDH
jgi:nitronate monooxygenase